MPAGLNQWARQGRARFQAAEVGGSVGVHWNYRGYMRPESRPGCVKAMANLNEVHGWHVPALYRTRSILSNQADIELKTQYLEGPSSERMSEDVMLPLWGYSRPLNAGSCWQSKFNTGHPEITSLSCSDQVRLIGPAADLCY